MKEHIMSCVVRQKDSGKGTIMLHERGMDCGALWEWRFFSFLFDTSGLIYLHSYETDVLQAAWQW